ncbi:VOC family protein [Candidatus Poribacteria bacterium]|nr:VOC family protein [Candidatus Poribacteria bacterium]
MITSLQHVGLGVTDAAASYDFYKKVLGFPVKISDYVGASKEMEPIIGELVKMRIIMALSARGRGLVELVQYLSTSPRPLEMRWGDIGFLATGYRVDNLPGFINRLQQIGVKPKVRSYVTELASRQRWESAFLADPDGNLIELVDISPGAPVEPNVSGLVQVTVGVRDIDKSLPFYRDILGYNVTLLDIVQEEPGLQPLFGRSFAQRQVLLQRTERLNGPFVTSDGGVIRLVQVLGYQGKELFAGRRWGDIGQMECCFEVDDIRAAVAEVERSMKTKAYCSPTYMDMGAGTNAFFAYIKDPDGTLIEFDEVKKVLWMKPLVFAAVLRFFFPVIAWMSR